MTVRKPCASHCHRSQPGPGIQKLNLCFDLGKLQAAGVEARQLSVDQGVGFRSIPITCCPQNLNHSKLWTVPPLECCSSENRKNNCNPGETYRKTPSLCKIPILYRANFAEDRHQHSRGGLSIFSSAKKGSKRACASEI